MLTINSKYPKALKICGITKDSQAKIIASLGVNAIGVIGVKSSPRYVTEENRKIIFSSIKAISPNIQRVWVIANMSDSAIENGISKYGVPSTIQLHGQESQNRCENLRSKYPSINWWKAFRVKSPEDLTLVKSYENSVDALLLDSWSKNSLGGTGKRINREWIQNITFKIPWWLAGGISSKCIEEIFNSINPYGVDVSSKLETSPGIKDISKVKDLINIIRKINS